MISFRAIATNTLARALVVGPALLIVVGSLDREALGSSVETYVGCGQRAESDSPTVFNDPRFKGRTSSVLVGPLELRGASQYASPQVFARLGRRNGYVQAKVALVVQARRSLRVTASGTNPQPVLLAYGSGEATSQLLIRSCSPNTPARTRRGVVGSGTLFTGVFELPAAECVTLRILDRATMRAWRARLAFGRTCST